MLARRNGQDAALGQRRVAEEMQFVDEPAVHAQQLRVARELDQPVVKLDVGREIGVDVALARRRAPSGRRASESSRTSSADAVCASAPARRTRRARREARRSRRLPRSRIWRTNTPRFFSSRTSPDSSSARNASRTGPRETPSRSRNRRLVQLARRREARRRESCARAPAGRAPAESSTGRARSRRRRAPGTTQVSPSRGPEACAAKDGRRRCRRQGWSSASCALDPHRCRLSTIYKKVLPSQFRRHPMSLFSRDPILLTPGPITTSLATKMAMLRDWGSWDANFNAVTAEVRKKLLDVVHGHDTHVCVPMQGSGTFSVEAAINTLVPRAGHVLVLINGAYGLRLAKLTQMMGRQGHDVRDGGGRAHDARGRRPAAEGRPLHHACRPHPLRDVDRHPQSAAGNRRRRRASRQEPHRRCDELVRRDRHRRPHDAVRRPDCGLRQVHRRPAGHGLCAGAPQRARTVRGQLDVAIARSPRPVDLHGKDDAMALHAGDARRRRVQRRARPACRRGRTTGAARPLCEELRDARRRIRRTRLQALPAAGNPGADHLDVPCAARPGVQLQGVLRARP